MSPTPSQARRARTAQRSHVFIFDRRFEQRIFGRERATRWRCLLTPSTLPAAKTPRHAKPRRLLRLPARSPRCCCFFSMIFSMMSRYQRCCARVRSARAALQCALPRCAAPCLAKCCASRAARLFEILETLFRRFAERRATRRAHFLS